MKYKITLNGKVYEVEVEKGKAVVMDEYAAPVAAPSMPAQPVAAPAATAAPAAAGAGEAVKSPMPGVVIDIKVSAGQAVKAGDTVVILEAMKMENEIAATRDGVISSVAVSKGAAVETGATLVTIS